MNTPYMELLRVALAVVSKLRPRITMRFYALLSGPRDLNRSYTARTRFEDQLYMELVY